MTDIRIEVGGSGSVRYRCATCGELIDGPTETVDGLTYHPEHVPEP